jgi:prepilin-type N-terminal cleavage/methylation domain
MLVSIHSDRRLASATRRFLHRTRSGPRARGFTLIELMITVAVIAILAAIAVPSYYQYILRSNRSAAESFMQEVASAQERYMVDSRQFAGALTTLGYGVPNTVSPSYSVALVATAASVSGGTGQSYTITAKPINGQVRDTSCATLTLNGDGSKSASGTATNCWK